LNNFISAASLTLNANLVEGQEFSGRMRELSMTRMLAFAGGLLANPGWPAKNLHTDPAKAKEARLRAPIASGLQYESDISRHGRRARRVVRDSREGNCRRRHGKLYRTVITASELS